MSSDSSSRRTAALRQVRDLEAQFKQLVAQKKTHLDKSCLTARESLQRAFEHALVNDWFAEDYDGETQMWKTCFYKPIEEWRKKIRTFSQMVSEAQGRNDIKRLQASQQEQGKASEAFHVFLEASTGFYHNFLAKLRAKYGISIDRCVMQSVKDPKDATYRHYMTTFRILIRLGDLARYQRDLAGFPDADWLAAWSYYMDAQKMMPEQGMPYNQLAVLCTYSHDTTGAFYYYARSLALKVPSETGKSNIEVLMRDASIAKYVEARRKYMDALHAPKRARAIGDGQPGTTTGNLSGKKETVAQTAAKTGADLWAVFVLGFFGFHSASNTLEIGRVQEHVDLVLEDFEALVKSDFLSLHCPSSVPGPQGALRRSTYMQMMVYNIFVASSIMSQLTASTSPIDAPTISLLANRLNLVLQLSLAMLCILVDRMSVDLATEVPHTSSQLMDDSNTNEGIPRGPPALSSAPFGGSPTLTSTTTASHTISKLDILPVVAVYLQWLTVTQKGRRIVHFDFSSEQEKARFSRLQQSLTRLVTMALPHAKRYQQTLEPQEKSKTCAPLPEDSELYSFLPLAPAHSSFSIRLLNVTHDSDEAFIRRCHRIVQFAARCAREKGFICASMDTAPDLTSYFASSPSDPSEEAEILLFTEAQCASIHASLEQRPLSASTAAHRASHSPSPSSLSQQQESMSPSNSQHSIGAHGKEQIERDKSAPIARPVFTITRSIGSEEEEEGYTSHSQEIHLEQHHQAGKTSSSQVQHQQQLQQQQSMDLLLPGSMAALDNLADAMDLDTSSHRLAIPPIQTHPRSPIVNPLSNSMQLEHGHGFTRPRILFGDSTTSEPNSMALDQGAVHAPTNVMATDLPANVTSMNVDQLGQAPTAGTSSYDPWGRHAGDYSNLALDSHLRSSGGVALAPSAPPPTFMSNNAPIWNPFLTPGEALHPQPSADPLSSSLLGLSTHQAQDPHRPLLFPSSTFPSSNTNPQQR